MKKSAKIILGVLVLSAASYGIYYWISASSVPQSFNDARSEGALISSQIVALLGDSLKGLETISEEDRNYNFSKAFDLVLDELNRTKIAREKALDLSSALDKMARAVKDISPTKARNIAMQAVSQEVSLIGNLVVYNDTLRGLLETLRYKFSGDIRYDADDVQKLIVSLNKKAKEITSLNDSFNGIMGEFDKLVNK